MRVWEGPGGSRRVPGSERVQKGMGGSRRVREGPGGSMRVLRSKRVWEGPGESGRVWKGPVGFERVLGGSWEGPGGKFEKSRPSHHTREMGWA